MDYFIKTIIHLPNILMLSQYIRQQKTCIKQVYAFTQLQNVSVGVLKWGVGNSSMSRDTGDSR